jgi:hypothetical protein
MLPTLHVSSLTLIHTCMYYFILLNNTSCRSVTWPDCRNVIEYIHGEKTLQERGVSIMERGWRLWNPSANVIYRDGFAFLIIDWVLARSGPRNCDRWALNVSNCPQTSVAAQVKGLVEQANINLNELPYGQWAPVSLTVSGDTASDKSTLATFVKGPLYKSTPRRRKEGRESQSPSQHIWGGDPSPSRRHHHRHIHSSTSIAIPIYL